MACHNAMNVIVFTTVCVSLLMVPILSQAPDCMMTLKQIHACRKDIEHGLLRGQMSVLSPQCCISFHKFDGKCWAKMLPPNPLYPPLVKSFCATHVPLDDDQVATFVEQEQLPNNRHSLTYIYDGPLPPGFVPSPYNGHPLPYNDDVPLPHDKVPLPPNQDPSPPNPVPLSYNLDPISYYDDVPLTPKEGSLPPNRVPLPSNSMPLPSTQEPSSPNGDLSPLEQEAWSPNQMPLPPNQAP